MWNGLTPSCEQSLKTIRKAKIQLLLGSIASSKPWLLLEVGVAQVTICANVQQGCLGVVHKKCIVEVD